MALFTPGSTRCSICGNVLQKDDEMEVIGEFRCPPGHPIERFLDSCVHRECFEKWEYRDAFLSLYQDRFAWQYSIMTGEPPKPDPLKPERWSDFRRRADYAPSKVYRHRACDWEYIPIHPFADETETLVALGRKQSDCQFVDAWWGIEGDAALVEITTSALSVRPPGIYVKPTLDEKQWLDLEAVLQVPYITRAAFEDAMVLFSLAGFPHDPRMKSYPPGQWRSIDYRS